MNSFGKPLDTLTAEDIQRVIDEGWKEGQYLDFKAFSEDLELSKSETKNKILRAACAFANAKGGLLILGIEETENGTSEKTDQAGKVVPIKNCKAIAKNLERQLHDTNNIEDRLPSCAVQAVFTNEEEGSGVIVIHVGESYKAPHGVVVGKDSKTSKGGRVFTIRRGDRSEPMTTMEIKDLTLKIAQSGDRIERLFQQRFDMFKAHIEQTIQPHNIFVYKTVLVPLREVSLQSLDRNLLFNSSNLSNYYLNKNNAPQELLTYEPILNGVRLHSEMNPQYPDLVEFDYKIYENGVIDAQLKFRKGETDNRVFAPWLVVHLSFILNVVYRIQKLLGDTPVEYGLKCQSYVNGTIAYQFNNGHPRLNSKSLPVGYSELVERSVPQPESYNELILSLINSMQNLVGWVSLTPEQARNIDFSPYFESDFKAIDEYMATLSPTVTSPMV
jgi:hypothetical protein